MSDDVQITETAKPPGVAQVDRLESWIVLVPKGFGENAWRRVPHGRALNARRRRRGGRGAELFATDLPNASGTRAVVLEVRPGVAAFERLGAARRAVKRALDGDPRVVAVTPYGLEAEDAGVWLEALVSAVLARAAPMPSLKSGHTAHPRVRRLRVLGHRSADRYARARAEAAGNGLARYLSALPSTELTPAVYRERVAALAREHGWTMEFLDAAALRRRGAGAFLAVAQGSPANDAGIVRLGYRPADARARTSLALVGKGICFDTGGVNLKTARGMLGMHEDMQGSAVALGTLLALSTLNVDFRIDCWLALATNHVGPDAYKPGDIVRAANGTTVEVIHTDAEGRMVLADTLVFASRAKPSLILDFATLTGACVQALGKGYSGVFTNREALNDTLVRAGRRSGERVWPFPQDEDYDEGLESTMADVRQCAVEGGADHILAARFLSRFVADGCPWVHVDLSSGMHKGGLAHVPTDTTGFGVRFAASLLLDDDVLERLSAGND